MPVYSRPAAVLVLLALVASACSFSFSTGGDSTSDVARAAEALVRTLDADEGLGLVEISCDEPADTDDGTSFACESPVADGSVITWTAVIDGDDIDVDSDNLVTTGGLAALVDAVAQVVGEQTGQPFTGADIDCGSAPIVLDATGEIGCDLALPGGGSQQLIVTVTDTRSGDFEVRAAG